MAAVIAILAALPREIQGLVAGARAAPAQAAGIRIFHLPGAVVVSAGMGRTRVALAFEAAMGAGPVSEVVSVGLAGACDPALRAGSVVEPDRVVDVRTGERFVVEGTGAGSLLLASSEEIASVTEKQRLRAAYGEGLVDMEAATVARLAHAHGLPFRAVKGVSDAHDFELASLGQFTGSRGEFRTGAFAMHTALRPARWQPAMELGRHSARALAGLTVRLRELISEAK